MVSSISRLLGSCRSRSTEPAPPVPRYHFAPHDQPRYKVKEEGMHLSLQQQQHEEQQQQQVQAMALSAARRRAWALVCPLGKGNKCIQHPLPSLLPAMLGSELHGTAFEFPPMHDVRSLLLQVLVDRETQHASVYVSYKHARLRISTPQEFREHLALSLFEIALNNRCVDGTGTALGLQPLHQGAYSFTIAHPQLP